MSGGDGDRALIDTAIDLDMVGKAAALPIRKRRRHFRHGFIFHEGLPTEPGHHRHNEEQVNPVKIRHHRLNRCRRVQGEAAAKPCGPRPRKRIAHVMIRFNMNGDSIGPGGNKAIKIFVRPRHHEMNVQCDRGTGSDSGYKLRPEGDIFDKMAVHHIEVEPIRSGLLSSSDLLTDPGPVGCENGGGNDSVVAVAHAGAIIFTVSLFRKP